MMKNLDFGARRFRFESQFSTLHTVSPWANDSTSLLIFFSKIEVVLIPISEDF